MSAASGRAGEVLRRMEKVVLGGQGGGAAAEIPETESTAIDAAPRPPTTVTSRRKRFTLDLEPEQHRFMTRFAFDNDVRARAVLCACLTLLENDRLLAERVIALAREEGGGE